MIWGQEGGQRQYQKNRDLENKEEFTRKRCRDQSSGWGMGMTLDLPEQRREHWKDVPWEKGRAETLGVLGRVAD